jgi:Ca-activated chloride channel family protein
MMEGFHFLRPAWLLALPPLAWLIWRWIRPGTAPSPWSRHIDPELLPHVIEGYGRGGARWPLWLLALAWTLAALALAGPAWERAPRPLYAPWGGTVIAFDLSRSMDATDLPPSRLQHARNSLLRMLEQAHGEPMALIVFAADAYRLLPLTTDTAVIANLIPALGTNLVPVQGSRPDRAIDLADALLTSAHVGDGRILLITDGSADQGAALAAARRAADHGHRLSVLAVGRDRHTALPLKGGGRQAVAFREADLRRLASSGNGQYRRLDTTPPRWDELFPFRPGLGRSTAQSDESVTVWLDRGAWLLLPLLPLALLGFRRGWLACLLPLVLLHPQPADAGGWWLTADQRAAQAVERGAWQEAAETFTDPLWKGSSLYRAHRYAEAARILATVDHPLAHYNRGNALARIGRLEEARDAYRRALSARPEDADARHNLRLVESLLEQRREDGHQDNRPLPGRTPIRKGGDNAPADRQRDTVPPPQDKRAAQDRKAAEEPRAGETTGGGAPPGPQRPASPSGRKKPAGTPGGQSLPGRADSSGRTPMEQGGGGSRQGRSPSTTGAPPKAGTGTEGRNAASGDSPDGGSRAGSHSSGADAHGSRPSATGRPPMGRSRPGQDTTRQAGSMDMDAWLQTLPLLPADLLREKLRREHWRRPARADEEVQW